jgi:hypothetical protein
MAPRIKESHRIELAESVILPLVRCHRRVPEACPALTVLRDTERHLGRWLCIGELTQLSGSSAALAEACRLAVEGPEAARAAWSLVAWALDPASDCATRPTLEVVARLSDRPSAERDLSFLFRMADNHRKTAKPMLESLVKAPGLSTDLAVRAAASLARDHGRNDLLMRLLEAARNSKREPLRGLALAAFADCQRDEAIDIAVDLSRSRNHVTLGFATLVRVAILRNDSTPIVTESTYRRLQLGRAD